MYPDSTGRGHGSIPFETIPDPSLFVSSFVWFCFVSLCHNKHKHNCFLSSVSHFSKLLKLRDGGNPKISSQLVKSVHDLAIHEFAAGA